MPYTLEGNCVKKAGKTLKCYDNHKDALAYFRALQANVHDKSLVEMNSMFITKSVESPNGLRKWAAVNSDTDPDLYDERMSLELYRKMLSYIREEVPPPSHFKSIVCSDYWCGGMPYVSLAHYPDLNGKAVPGETLELFIDGKQLKAKGIMNNTPLGNAVWKSLKKDENLSNDENKIRISIAFLDLAHKHGETGKVFVRESDTSVCAECRKGVGNKIYLDGYLVHLALTRVPVNPRTSMTEDIMAKKSKIETRREDAVSIVEDEALVDEIEKSALEAKSDVLIEMSETEEPVAEAPVVVEEAKTKDAPVEDEEDGEEEMKDKKGKKNCSLTEDDLEVIKSLIVEAIKVPEAPVVPDVVAEKSDTVSKSVLDIATDELYNSVNVALSMPGATLEERLESINPALQTLGTSITAMVRESMGQVAPKPEDNNTGMVLEAVNSLTQTVKDLATEVAQMKAQSIVTDAPVPNKMPVPRSIQTPQFVTNSQTVPEVKQNSVANIVRRSVSPMLAPVNR